MRTKADHARGWFMKADSDLLTGRRLLQANGPYDTACFHAQQAVERYLKGLLAWAERPIPRTHNLEELQYLCSLFVPTLDLNKVDLARSEEHTSELQSRQYLVCRLLLEKKKNNHKY